MLFLQRDQAKGIDIEPGWRRSQQGFGEGMSEPRVTPEASMEEILASIRRIISEDGSPPAPQAAPQPVTPQPMPPPAAAQPPAAPIPPAPMSPAFAATALPPPAASLSSTPPAPLPIRPKTPSEPASVWGIFGDRPPVDGEALVLTQMLAEDGSVVALGRPAGDTALAAAPRVSVETSNPRPLDILLLTDALPPGLPETGVAPTQPRPTPTIAPPASVPPPRPTLSPGPQLSAGGSPPAAPRPPVASGPPTVDPAPTELARNQARDSGPTLEELVRQSLEPKVQEWLNSNLKNTVERLVQREIERIRQRTE